MCPEKNDPALLPAFTGPEALTGANGLTLAFVGDAVWELLARDRALNECGGRVQALHRETVAFSNAAFQSAAAKAILPLLTEEEAAVFRRGRNARPGHVPKNKTQADYHLATALEAVFGYLYLTKNLSRMRALFGAAAALYEAQKNEEQK